MNYHQTIRRLAASKYTIYLASPVFFVSFIAAFILNLLLPSHSYNAIVFALPFMVHVAVIGLLAARATGSNDASLQWVTVHGSLVGLLSALPALAIGGACMAYAFATDHSESILNGVIAIFVGATAGVTFAVGGALAICGTLAAWLGGWLGR